MDLIQWGESFNKIIQQAQSFDKSIHLTSRYIRQVNIFGKLIYIRQVDIFDKSIHSNSRFNMSNQSMNQVDVSFYGDSMRQTDKPSKNISDNK